MTDPTGFRPTPPDLPMKDPDEPPGWFDKPKNVTLLKRLAILIAIGFFVADFFIHYHEIIGLENLPGYYLTFGLVASVILILVSKGAGKGLKREEDYYDE